MPLDQTTFLTRHPEFAEIATSKPGLVAAAIADANAEIADDTWGDKAVRGQALHAAGSLGRSPFGMQAAIRDDEGNVLYEKELDRLRMLVGGVNRPVLP
jgi:hypothetical protein